MTKDSSQIALWLYMWAGYENVAASDGHNVYFDDLTLTAVSGSSDNNPGTFDIIAVAAIIGMHALPGSCRFKKETRLIDNLTLFQAGAFRFRTAPDI